MKNEENIPYKFESLSESHRAFGLPMPQHPLISFRDNMDNKFDLSKLPHPRISTVYKISYKKNLSGKLKYGQNYYDFDEGGMFFVSPNQLVGNDDNNGDHTGYTLLIHPDFFLGYPLAKKIKQYGFFSYSANEALHLSDSEKTTIISIFKIIAEELNSRIDDFSQDVIISQIELLLNYSNRFYKRQFITRKAVHNDLLQKLEEILDDYFKGTSKNLPLPLAFRRGIKGEAIKGEVSGSPLKVEKSTTKGLPTVQYLADHLSISPSYLSDMLRSLTGQNAQQHIHNKLIEKAKERLSTTALSVSEIAYELGFEHPQSFSKLFKTKTSLSPLEFRQSFN